MRHTLGVLIRPAPSTAAGHPLTPSTRRRPLNTRYDPAGRNGALAGSPDARATYVRTHRAGRGLSQARLAAEAGLSRQTIMHMEQGKSRRPHRQTLAKLAAILEPDSEPGPPPPPASAHGSVNGSLREPRSDDPGGAQGAPDTATPATPDARAAEPGRKRQRGRERAVATAKGSGAVAVAGGKQSVVGIVIFLGAATFRGAGGEDEPPETEDRVGQRAGRPAPRGTG
jgi:transcriptional regulator with XRE-family HTH domain